MIRDGVPLAAPAEDKSDPARNDDGPGAVHGGGALESLVDIAQ